MYTKVHYVQKGTLVTLGYIVYPSVHVLHVHQGTLGYNGLHQGTLFKLCIKNKLCTQGYTKVHYVHQVNYVHYDTLGTLCTLKYTRYTMYTRVHFLHQDTLYTLCTKIHQVHYVHHVHQGILGTQCTLGYSSVHLSISPNNHYFDLTSGKVEQLIMFHIFCYFYYSISLNIILLVLKFLVVLIFYAFSNKRHMVFNQ